MLFRRIILNALFIGILSGLLFSVMQYFSVSPIIFAAEVYEIAELEAEVVVQKTEVQGHHHGAEGGHEHVAHEHNEEAWGPEDGVERTFYSVLSNVLAGIGFAAILLAMMSQLQLQGVTKVSLAKGLLWGAAGFLAFFAAPGIGLPPEIPGIDAAPLENRQYWWILTVLASGIGLTVLAFAKGFYKIAGVVLIAVPFIVGAPHISGPEFSHPDAAAVATLIDLHHQFIIASGISNLVFWLAIGGLCAWALNRKILVNGLDGGHASA